MRGLSRTLGALFAASVLAAPAWAAAEIDVTGLTPTDLYTFNGNTSNAGTSGRTWNGNITVSGAGARGEELTAATGSPWTTQKSQNFAELGCTISVLAKAGETAENGVLLALNENDSIAQTQWAIKRGAANKIVLSALFTEEYTIAAADDKFHHIVVSLTKDKVASVYIDGVKQDTSSYTVAPHVTEFRGYQLNAKWGDSAMHFNRPIADGNWLVDDLRIYGAVLTDAQVAKLNVALSKDAYIGEVRDLGIAIPENTNIRVKVTPQEVINDKIKVNVTTENLADADSITWTLCADEYERGATKVFDNRAYALTATLPVGFESSEFTTEGAPILAKAVTINENTSFGVSSDESICRTIDGHASIVAKLNGNTKSDVYGAFGNGAIEGAAPLEKNIYLNATSGEFGKLVGGSHWDWSNNGRQKNLTGDVVVELGKDATADHVVGAGLQGINKTLTGNVTLKIHGNVKGAVIAGWTSAHQDVPRVVGDTSVEITHVLSDNTAQGINSTPSDIVVGGGAYESNSASGSKIEGATSVKVLIPESTGNFNKRIIGGSYAKSGNSYVITGSTSVLIDAPNVAFNAPIYGATWRDDSNSASTQVQGNSSVTINGGIFKSTIYAGGFGGNSTVSGTATLTLNGGNFSEATIAPGKATNSKLVINKDVTIATLQAFNEYEVADDVVLTVNTANLSGVTVPMTVVSGTGTVTIGKKRNVTYAGFGLGVVAVTVTANEIVGAQLQLPVTTAVTSVPEAARFALTSETGTTITPTEITLADNMLTITLPSMYVTVTESNSWSEAVGEASGAVLVVGGATAENAPEITIDTAVAEVITEICIAGYVKMSTAEGVTFPANKVKFVDGAHLELDAAVQNGNWIIPNAAKLTLFGGTTEAARTVSNAITVQTGGMLVTKENLILSSTSNTIATGGTLEVASGVTTLAAGDCTIKGTITINADAELVAASTDALDYNNESVINIYGTLNMSNKRWTVFDGNVFNLYAGGCIIGAGERDRTALEVCENNTVNILANGDATTVTISTPMRSRDDEDVITFNVANGLTCTYGGSFDGSGKIKAAGAGVLKLTTQNANGGGTIVDAGATLVAASATALGTGSVTNSGTLELNAADVEATLAQVISGGGAINVKAGSWALTAANTGNKNVTIESGAMVDISSENARLGYEGQASGSVVTVKGTLKVRDWNWNTDNCLGKLDHNPDRLRIDGGKIIFTENVTSARKATLSGDVTFEIEENVVVTPTEKLTVNGNLTINGDGKLVLSGENVFSANSNLNVTVNGTLESKGTETTFYRTVLGDGKIVIPEGTKLAIGEATGHTGETSGLSRFAGTLEVAGTFDARSWAGREYVIGACDVKVLEGGKIEKYYSNSSAAKLSIASGKTLSGAGTIEFPVTFADGATLDASAGPLTVSGTVTIADDVTVTVTLPESPTAGREILKCSNPSDIVGKLTATPMPTGLKFAATDDAVVLAAVPTIVIPPVAEGEGSVALSAESQATLLVVAQNQGLTEVTTVSGSTTVNGTETRLTAAQIDNALAVFGDSIVKADGTTLKVDYNFGIVSVTPDYYNGTINSFIVKVAVKTADGTLASIVDGADIELVDSKGVTIEDGNGWKFQDLDRDGMYEAYFSADPTAAHTLIGRSFKVKATK